MVGDCQIKASVFISSFFVGKSCKSSNFMNQEQQCNLFIHGCCICVSMDRLTFICSHHLSFYPSFLFIIHLSLNYFLVIIFSVSPMLFPEYYNEQV